MYFRNGINHIIYIICAVSEPVPYQVEKNKRAFSFLFVIPVNSRKDPEPPLLNFKNVLQGGVYKTNRVDEN